MCNGMQSVHFAATAIRMVIQLPSAGARNALVGVVLVGVDPVCHTHMWLLSPRCLMEDMLIPELSARHMKTVFVCGA